MAYAVHAERVLGKLSARGRTSLELAIGLPSFRAASGTSLLTASTKFCEEPTRWSGRHVSGRLVYPPWAAWPAEPVGRVQPAKRLRRARTPPMPAAGSPAGPVANFFQRPIERPSVEIL